MKGPIDIYYDEDGDFLELTVTNPPAESYCEDVSNDVFVRKDEKTGEIMGIGILNFKTHSGDLKDILVKVPVKINFEMLKKQADSAR